MRDKQTKDDKEGAEEKKTKTTTLKYKVSSSSASSISFLTVVRLFLFLYSLLSDSPFHTMFLSCLFSVPSISSYLLPEREPTNDLTEKGTRQAQYRTETIQPKKHKLTRRPTNGTGRLQTETAQHSTAQHSTAEETAELKAHERNGSHGGFLVNH